MEKILFIFGCLIPVTICGYTDIKKGLIYNKITIPMLLMGLAYSVYISSIQNALLGLIIGFGVLFLCFLIGGVGGGDVKLSAALGAWFGCKIAWLLVIASLICVLWGGFKLFKQEKLKTRTKLFCNGLLYQLVYGAKGTLILPKLPDENNTSEEAVPFGICLAVASWVIFLFMLSTTFTFTLF